MRWVELYNYLVMDVHNSRRVKLLVLRCGHPKLTTKSVMKRAGGGGAILKNGMDQNPAATDIEIPPLTGKRYFFAILLGSLGILFDMPFEHIKRRATKTTGKKNRMHRLAGKYAP